MFIFALFELNGDEWCSLLPLLDHFDQHQICIETGLDSFSFTWRFHSGLCKCTEKINSACMFFVMLNRCMDLRVDLGTFS